MIDKPVAGMYIGLPSGMHNPGMEEEEELLVGSKLSELPGEREALSPRQLAAYKGHLTRRLRRRLLERVKAFVAQPRRWQIGRVVISIKEVKALK